MRHSPTCAFNEGAGDAAAWRRAALGIQDHSDAILYAAILAAASLWLLETTLKGLQYCPSERIIKLEARYRDEGPTDIPPFQIYTACNQVFLCDRKRYLYSRMRPPFIAMPYAIEMAVYVGAIWLQH